MKRISIGCRIRFLCLFMVMSQTFALRVDAAGVTFYTDEQEWLQRVGQLQNFALNAQNIALADEISVPPAPNTDVGGVLTFQSANTGLSQSYRIRTLEQPAAVFVYNNPNFVDQSTTKELLDVGVWHGQYQNDDWELQILLGSPLFAFAFDLVGNDNNAGESFAVYGPGSVLYGSVVPPWDGSPWDPQGTNFLGVIADSPIERLYFDEDSGSDEIAIANLRFATPEPATLLLLTLGGLLLRKRKA